jgi:hypothetical protein
LYVIYWVVSRNQYCFNVPFSFSVAEIPTKDSVLPSLPHLTSITQDFAGVDDESSTPDARMLWNERLQVCHRGNARRLRELYVSHGFYVPLDDYNLPGK